MKKFVYGLIAMFALLAVVPEADAGNFFFVTNGVTPVTVGTEVGNTVFFTPNNVVLTPGFTPFVTTGFTPFFTPFFNPFFGFRTGFIGGGRFIGGFRGRGFRGR